MLTITQTTRKTIARIAVALSFCAVLAAGSTAMANDSFIQDAFARNDTQVLPDNYSGGATFLAGSNSNVNTNPAAFRSTMQDAFARNDSQLLPGDNRGGATFTSHSGTGSIGNFSQYQSTMRDAYAQNDTQILPDQMSGGATFFN